MQWTNWSGGVAASPRAYGSPATPVELGLAVRNAMAPVRVSGSGHSFTPLVATDGTLITLERLAGLTSFDTENARATVAAGTTIRNLGPMLYEAGLGLINQGDIDRQTISGAIGTGTHGTGGTLGSLSAAVLAFDLVLASGEQIHCSPTSNAALYEAGRVSFGTLGVMSAIEMQCRPRYGLAETGGRMAIQDVLRNVERYRDGHRHFEFFWFPLAEEAQVKFLDESAETPKPRVRRPDGFEIGGEKTFRWMCELARFLPITRSAVQRRLTASAPPYDPSQGGRVRWSHDAFPSDRNVRFNEMEYAVPAARGIECVQEIGDYLRRSGINFVFPIEFRYVAADDIWLSPFYKRDSVTISVHQYHRQSYRRLFDSVEKIFRRYEGRPHWGKLHSLTADDFVRLYPKWDDYRRLRQETDPEGKFLTPYLRRIFGV